MDKIFIGREKECALLNEYLESPQSEFIAVYGRRRVGKTSLIQHVIGNKYAFYVAGMDNVPMRMQLDNFMEGIRKRYPKTPKVNNWLEAFIALENYLDKLPKGRKIVFIDEMPWMDTPKSHFISGLEHFWNSWASWHDDIKLIVCGSATSWIINNLIKNRGGLHNRVTHKISLQPFTLRECKQYFEARGFRLHNRQVAECYMIFGGVPYYLSKMNKGESVAQNIDRLLFSPDGELADEFQSLYNSLYRNAPKHIKIVTALASKGNGLTRQELLKKTGIPDNGKFSMLLSELQHCGFIRSYKPYLRSTSNRQSPDTIYQLIDPFTLFHFQVAIHSNNDHHFCTNSQNSHRYSTWAGLSFEMLCLNHINQIKESLGIAGVVTSEYSWIGSDNGHSVQIDMLIDRADNTINICEMKYYHKPFALSSKTAGELENKVFVFKNNTHSNKNLILTLITADEIEHNEFSNIIQKNLVLNDLFK